MGYSIAYGLGAVLFFGYICYDEMKSFVGNNKPILILGLVASIFWPIFLVAMLGDFLEVFLGRIRRRKN